MFTHTDFADHYDTDSHHSPFVVLKFGSSILSDIDQLASAALEVERHVKAGRQVVAVASAFRGRTNALLTNAARLDAQPDDHALAALLATGEAEAAAYLALAIRQLGIHTQTLTPQGLGLIAQGPATDASIVHVEPRPVVAALQLAPVVVVPGYAAVDARGRPVVLGRGGSDLSAIALAHGLGAQARLVKDVGWVYEWPPDEGGTAPRAFASLTWLDALALTDKAIQPKAIAFARRVNRPFRFVGLGSDVGTLIGALDTAFISDAAQLAVDVQEEKVAAH